MHELTIEGVIGWDATSSEIRSDLKGKTGPLTVYINSVGGDVFDGISIFNQLQRHDGPVNVVVDGIAASAASFIAMAGERITMGTGAQFMIHLPYSVFVGDRTQVPVWDNVLRTAEESILDIYETRIPDRSELVSQMEAETWFTAAEAIAAGFADDMSEEFTAAASCPDKLYNHTPAAILSKGSGAEDVMARVLQATFAGISKQVACGEPPTVAKKLVAPKAASRPYRGLAAEIARRRV